MTPAVPCSARSASSTAGASPEHLVVIDLVNALLAENLFDLTDRCGVIRASEGGERLSGWTPMHDQPYLGIHARTGRWTVVFAAHWSALHAGWRMTRPPLLCFDGSGGGTPRSLTATELMHLFIEDIPECSRHFPGLPVFLRDLELAAQQGRLALEAGQHVERGLMRSLPTSLVQWERLAALRDRPFHPTSRVRRGWDEADYRRYSAEHGGAMLLGWVAVERAWMRRGSGARDVEPADIVLSGPERQMLSDALADQGVAETHIAIPMHPWQAARLSCWHGQEIQAGSVKPLSLSLGRYVATSSVRTLAPEAEDGAHLKLPLAIASLGARRMLPPHYLHNGELAQSVLEGLIARDARLAQRLMLCDERAWWTCVPPRSLLTDGNGGALGCLLRRYPQCHAEGTLLLPLSALAVCDQNGGVPALAALLGREWRADDALRCFAAIATLVCEVAFLCFERGVMPELHGQNVLLVHRPGTPLRILLRDHDTLRIYEPAVRQGGMNPPDYLLRPGPNTLVLQTTEALLSYFQTLALQVMLPAIAHALAVTSGLGEGRLCLAMREAVERALNALDLLPETRAVLEKELFVSCRWPFKLIVRPLLEQTSCGDGMPSGCGSTSNPLHDIDRSDERT